MSTTHRGNTRTEATEDRPPCHPSTTAATPADPQVSHRRVAVVPGRRTAQARDTHSVSESVAHRHLEQAIHDAFELPSAFTLEELAALVGFVLCRGARLRLTRGHYSVEHDDVFTWVHGTRGEDQRASNEPTR